MQIKMIRLAHTIRLLLLLTYEHSTFSSRSPTNFIHRREVVMNLSLIRKQLLSCYCYAPLNSVDDVSKLVSYATMFSKQAQIISQSIIKYLLSLCKVHASAFLSNVFN